MTLEEITLLENLLAKAKASNDNHPDPQVRKISEISIGLVPVATNMEAAKMCVVKGPYFDKGRKKPFRIKVIDTESGKQTSHCYLTEDEAKAAIPQLEAEYKRPLGCPFRDAVKAYVEYQTAKGIRPRSIESTLTRINYVFLDDMIQTGMLTKEYCVSAWNQWCKTPGRRHKRLPSVATKHSVLNELRTLLSWLKDKGWIRDKGYLDSIEITGVRGRGKLKFSAPVDESRAFVNTGLKLAQTGDLGALAALTALLMGMRASEIAEIRVGDFDNQGRDLRIPNAKTQAGIRRLTLPDMLMGLYQNACKGLKPADKVFGALCRRTWVRRAVRRVCKKAGVTVISAHGLRGVHAELAVGTGMTGVAIAASLGHEAFGVTERHYAGSGAVQNAKTARVLGILN